MYPVYYDTETTGLKPEQDRIIEIAAFNPATGQSFVQFINPGIPIPKEASAISRITDEMVANAQTFALVGKAFIEFCGPGAVLIAHNNDRFDKPFIESEFSRASLNIPSWKYVDSLKWARKYRSDLPSHGLQVLREVYGIEANQAHRALDDVIVLHKLFSLMTGDLPIETILQLMSAPTPASSPNKMPFGKHAGKALSEVPANYVRWLAEEGALDKAENRELKEQFEKLGLLAKT